MVLVRDLYVFAFTLLKRTVKDGSHPSKAAPYGPPATEIALCFCFWVEVSDMFVFKAYLR